MGLLVVQVQLEVLDQRVRQDLPEAQDLVDRREVPVQVDQQEVQEVLDLVEVQDQQDLVEALDHLDHQDLLVHQVPLEQGEVQDHPERLEFQCHLKAHTQPVRHTQLMM